MNVDDAMRRFRASIPGPSDALVMRIVESATGGAHRAHRRRRRISPRTVLVTASVMTAIVGIIVLGAVIRGGKGPSPAPAAPAIPPARVDWGMVATVKLIPDPGISIDEMRERFATALTFRTHDNDGAGVEVLSASGDEVTVRLPGAEINRQAASYLTFDRLIVLNDDPDEGKHAASSRSTPAVPSSAVTNIQRDGASAVVTVSDRPLKDRDVRVFVGTSESDDQSGSAALFLGTGTLTTTGELIVIVNSKEGLQRVARTDIGGWVTLLRHEAYGAKPKDDGEAYAVGNAAVAKRLNLSAHSRLLRLAAGDFDGQETELVGIRTDGHLARLGTHTVGAQEHPMDGWNISTTDTETVGKDVCPSGIGTPRVVSCGPSVESGVPRQGLIRMTYTDFGRVAPEIARIRLRYGRSEEEAIIHDGWWLVKATTDVAASGMQPVPGRDASPRAHITAWDTNGSEVPLSPAG